MTSAARAVDSPVGWQTLIELTREMIQLASCDRWEALQLIHLKRETLLQQSSNPTRAQIEGNEGQVRELLRLNEALVDLVEREKREIANRLERLGRDSGACKAYRDHSFDSQA